MKITIFQLGRRVLAAVILALLPAIPHALAGEALLLQDTYVDTARSTTNYGTAGDLRVYKSSTGTMRAFLKFNIATVPAGTTANDVKQARLRLWVNSSSTTLGAITMTPITSAWSESTITNTTSSSLTFGLPKHAELPISYIGQFVSIDVTDWVQAWLAGTLANQGFQIEASANTATLSLYFDSKESTITSHEPVIEIDLATVGPQGPAGSPGPAGPQGIQGLQGATGVTGATGAAGPAGNNGPQGLTGPVGPRGMTWKGTWSSSLAYAVNDAVTISGSAYVALQANTNTAPPVAGIWDLLAQKGDIGITGPTGSIGPTGLAGPQGATGAVGVAGPQGATGAQGPQGDTGATGPIGLTGSQGFAGVNGPAGANGSRWNSWNVPPDVSWGSLGDYYLNSANGDVYVKIDSDGVYWNPAGNIKGPAGTQGIKGDPGAMGGEGMAGPQGLQGPAGAAGPAGAKGDTGAAGPAGSVGPEGLQGPAGVALTRIQPQGDLSMGEFTQGTPP